MRVSKFRRGPGDCWSSVAAFQRKLSPDFYVLHGPHWAAQGGPDPWTPPPPPATPLGRIFNNL